MLAVNSVSDLKKKSFELKNMNEEVERMLEVQKDFFHFSFYFGYC